MKKGIGKMGMIIKRERGEYGRWGIGKMERIIKRERGEYRR